MLYTFAFLFFFCKQKTAYEMRISDWSSDVCSSDLIGKRARCRGDDGPALGGEAGEEGGRAGNFDDPVDFPYFRLGNRFGLAARIDARRREAQYGVMGPDAVQDRKSTRLNSSH